MSWPVQGILLARSAMLIPVVLQHLTLSVSDGIFINPVGAAVVWSPAVPGSITSCSVRGNHAEAEPYFASCSMNGQGSKWQQSSLNLTLLQEASTSVEYDLESSEDSLRGSVAAFAANADAVAHVVSASGDSPIARLQLHIPSEAYFMTTLIEEVLAHP